MDSLVIVVIALACFFWAYGFYAKKLQNLWQIDPKRSTPAFTKYDSIDYIPAKNWLVLFGHHFASIAGAGPIIGPVIACMLWGWLPALLWVILGTIFIGGVHDFGALITSVRESGSSVADISLHVISKKAKVVFSLFVLLALILVITVFAWFCADTFVKEPKIVLPSLGLIPVAILVGYLLYFLRVNTVLTTILGLALLSGLIFLGSVFPINNTLTVWLLILFIYCYFASVLPVNILLQPRDYLSSFLLFLGIAVGYMGLLISRPIINMPCYYKFRSTEGYLWPMLFVTIACGAVSGFHALIASGTSSKQIACERHVKIVGYGAMVLEGLVAVLAIIACAVLFNKDWDNTLKSAGPIVIFAKGYGKITSSILGNSGSLVAIIILNAFILTTLDTATRISRYLTEELFSIKNRYISTLLVLILSAILLMSGKWNKIWPSFGASNQLVAALTLFVLSCWLSNKHKSAKLTLWPAIFMLVTTLAALITQLIRYFIQRDSILFMVSLLLVVLAGFMVYEIMAKIIKTKKQRLTQKVKHA